MRSGSNQIRAFLMEGRGVLYGSCELSCYARVILPVSVQNGGARVLDGTSNPATRSMMRLQQRRLPHMAQQSLLGVP